MTEVDQIQNSMNELAGIIARLSVIQMQKLMNEIGLSNSQMITLMQMNREGPCGVSQIAGRLGTTSAASSQMVQRLVELGLVQREEAAHDRRAKRISLTPQGKQVVDRMVENRVELLRAMVNNMPADRRAQAAETIELMVKSARAYEASQLGVQDAGQTATSSISPAKE